MGDSANSMRHAIMQLLTINKKGAKQMAKPSFVGTSGGRTPGSMKNPKATAGKTKAAANQASARAKAAAAKAKGKIK